MAPPRKHVPAQALAFLLMLLLGQADARRKKERPVLFTDCGTPDKLIHFTHLHAYPIPVRIPGTLYISMAGNVTSDLPRRMNVYLTIRKYFFGFPFTVPCLSGGVGSCSYENICNTLEHYERDGCPESLRQQGYSCHCPILAGEFTASDVGINIPMIEGFASTLLNGDYELQLTIEEEDGPQLGCLRVAFSIKKRRRRWILKIWRQKGKKQRQQEQEVGKGENMNDGSRGKRGDKRNKRKRRGQELSGNEEFGIQRDRGDNNEILDESAMSALEGRTDVSRSQGKGKRGSRTVSIDQKEREKRRRRRRRKRRRKKRKRKKAKAKREKRKSGKNSKIPKPHRIKPS